MNNIGAAACIYCISVLLKNAAILTVLAFSGIIIAVNRSLSWYRDTDKIEAKYLRSKRIGQLVLPVGKAVFYGNRSQTEGSAYD